MTIYKLGDIAEIINGSKVEEAQGEFPVVGSGGIFGYSKFQKTSGPSISIPRKGTMKILYYEFPVWNVDTVYLIEKIDTEKAKLKYIYYFLLDEGKWFHLITGSTRPAMTKTDWKQIEINLPTLAEQIKIIDIIEQKKDLFIKYSNTVNISNYNDCEKDFKKLIDIIEPIESLIKNISMLKKSIMEMTRNQYLNMNLDKHPINNEIIILNSNYEKQTKYIATNGIGLLEKRTEKIQILKEKIPSRANVSPKKNSFIISKLIGENKIFYFSEKPEEVFSTGFINFSSASPDHLLGFFLNKEWINQKNSLSTGTTMIALNMKNFYNIQIKKSCHNNEYLFTFSISKLITLENIAVDLRNKMIKLLDI